MKPTIAKRVRYLAIGTFAVYVTLCLVVGIALSYLSLHLQRMSQRSVTAFQEKIRAQYGADLQDVSISAKDRVVLRAWLAQPTHPNGRSVIILHGITSSRSDSTGFAEPFLAHGYTVLMPDSRSHGASGGDLATYGILERDDIHLWANTLTAKTPGCVYLLGESMGAAIALQAMTTTPELCAVAVEDPYSTFRSISYERLGRGTHTGKLFWQTLGRPVLEVAIGWTRLRYGFWLTDASPLNAVRSTRVPALLIAGTEDDNIPMHHAQKLQAACGARCSLWIVQGAGHCGASSVAHDEFEHRILDWFSSHPTVP
jgi:pimeloyl-ACP methyl ester carboxylesterase